jgi:hypothetical protein
MSDEKTTAKNVVPETIRLEAGRRFPKHVHRPLPPLRLRRHDKSDVRMTSVGSRLSVNHRGIEQKTTSVPEMVVSPATYPGLETAPEKSPPKASIHVLGDPFNRLSGRTVMGRRDRDQQITGANRRKANAKVESIIPSDLGLPYSFGETQFFETLDGGVRFIFGVNRGMSEMARRLAAASRPGIVNINSQIADQRFRIKTVIIAAATTRFILFKGEPILLLDPTTRIDRVPHEMGHALFHYFKYAVSPIVGGHYHGHWFLGQVADVYYQLKNIAVNNADGINMPAAMLVDPSVWNNKDTMEHPLDDVDEFLASATGAYTVNKAALTNTFVRFGKKHPSITKPWLRLQGLLNAMLAGAKLKESFSLEDPAAVQAELGAVPAPNRVEDNMRGQYPNFYLKTLFGSDRNRP